MKKVVRAVSLMLLMAGVCGNAFAEENENIVRQGTIRGLRGGDHGRYALPTGLCRDCMGEGQRDHEGCL